MELAELAMTRPGAWLRCPGTYHRNVADDIIKRRYRAFTKGNWEARVRVSEPLSPRYHLWIRYNEPGSSKENES
jgi:hypothetical protein